ncbi:hypothetical protein VST7929_01527 [Vibrio stylophorae]|uniref:Uncharacterized protein n=1 Tax=Vibrio stylophorae TaxID=659351 RepID=A0ABM8ZTK9_9VIBR|nr:hypothetical protein [Vibrio stylophorae]CAH0533656.1 hypothetical protein VST7929_01527 [Vibrio stylophorae]
MINLRLMTLTLLLYAALFGFLRWASTHMQVPYGAYYYLFIPFICGLCLGHLDRLRLTRHVVIFSVLSAPVMVCYAPEVAHYQNQPYILLGLTLLWLPGLGLCTLLGGKLGERL